MDKISGIYVVTDGELRPDRSHIDIVKASIDGGVKIVQLRDKKISDRQFYNIAVRIKEITSKAGVLFIVNDRVHIAAAVDADGVHVGQEELPVKACRKIVGDKSIIGLSVGNVEEALVAQEEGADYIGFGPVYSTNTKLDAGSQLGLELLGKVCKSVNIPVVAIGGISHSNIKDVAKTKVDSAAVVSAIVCATDMTESTRELISLWE